MRYHYVPASNRATSLQKSSGRPYYEEHFKTLDPDSLQAGVKAGAAAVCSSSYMSEAVRQVRARPEAHGGRGWILSSEPKTLRPRTFKPKKGCDHDFAPWAKTPGPVFG